MGRKKDGNRVGSVVKVTWNGISRLYVGRDSSVSMAATKS